jgi:hypothetical protein
MKETERKGIHKVVPFGQGVTDNAAVVEKMLGHAPLRQATGRPDLGAVLALQRAGYAPAEPVVRRLLADPELAVRQRALQWTGQTGITGLRGQLDRALAAGPVTPAWSKRRSCPGDSKPGSPLRTCAT